MGSKQPDYTRTEISTRYTPTAHNKRSLRDESSAPIVRIVGMGAFIALAFLGLIVRLWYLQVVQGDEHLRVAMDKGKGIPLRVRAARGIITDSNGKPLVTNITKFAILVRPGDGPDQFPVPIANSEIEKIEKKSPKLAEKLRKKQAEVTLRRDTILKKLQSLSGIAPETAIKNIEADQKRNRAGAPLVLAEGISNEDTIALLAEHRHLLSGVYMDVITVRRYASNQFAAHVLGYVKDIDEKSFNEKKRLFKISQSDDDNYDLEDKIGVKGIERSYEKILRGKPGTKEIGRSGSVMTSTDPVAGDSIQLNLQERVQRTAESAIEGRKGAIVAIDPQTGAVLAMASWPKYDPNVFQAASLTPEQNAYLNLDKKMQPQANRGVAPEPPGSTYKIVTATAGLAEKVITSSSEIYCSGKMKYEGETMRCMSKNGHGSISLIGAMAKSCNVFYGTVGKRLDAEKIKKWGTLFGLGVQTGADFGDSKTTQGNIPTRQSPQAEKRSWGWKDSAMASIGQGYVTCNPLQMARVVGAMSNGGIIYETHFAKAIIHSDGKKELIKPKIVSKLPVSKEIIAEVRRGLYACINSGTGKRAMVSGVDVMGKTGSAELGRRLPGSTKQASHAWFVGVGSKGGKQIAVCVFIDGHGLDLHGGQDAAPPGGRVISSYFYDTDQVPHIDRPTDEFMQKIEEAKREQDPQFSTGNLPNKPLLMKNVQGRHLRRLKSLRHLKRRRQH